MAACELRCRAKRSASCWSKGFCRAWGSTDRPQRRQSGFQEFGLPYAADAAITRYLAAFLTAHRDVAREDALPGDHDPARPDVVLLNGGFFESPLLRERLLEVLTSWFSHGRERGWRPRVLENKRLDLAVAQGAAYYGMVRRGVGVRVAANLARSYYIGLESDQPTAVCLVPGNAEPGQDFAIPNRSFEVTVSEPVEFPLFVSSLRLVDQPGDLVPIDPESMSALPPLRTVLKTRRRNERGTLPVAASCAVDRDRHDRFVVRRGGKRAPLAAAVRRPRGHADRSRGGGDARRAGGSAGRDELAGMSPAAGGRVCRRRQRRSGGTRETTHGRARQPSRPMAPVVAPPHLGSAVGNGIRPPPQRRARSPLAESLGLRAASRLRRGARRLAGGRIVAADPGPAWRFRVPSASPTSSGAGPRADLSLGQQVTVAEPLLSQVRSLHQHHVAGKRRQVDLLMKPAETAEVWRLLGSLELLPVPVKVELGDLLVALLDNKRLQAARSAMAWAVGRLGQRVPVYGPLNTVVPAEKAAAWLQVLLRCDRPEMVDQIAVMQLCRRTHDRHRDLDDALRTATVDWLVQSDARSHFVELVREGGQLDSQEQGQIIGESLPKGLRLL